MLLASEAEVKPNRLARGVAIALQCLCEETGEGDREAVLYDLWKDAPRERSADLLELISNS